MKLAVVLGIAGSAVRAPSIIVMARVATGAGICSRTMSAMHSNGDRGPRFLRRDAAAAPFDPTDVVVEERGAVGIERVRQMKKMADRILA